MSGLGQQRTSSAMPIYVRFRGLTGHPMSAFRDRCNFSPVMSGFGGKADVRGTVPKSPLLANKRHSRPVIRHCTLALRCRWWEPSTASIADIKIGHDSDFFNTLSHKRSFVHALVIQNQLIGWLRLG